MVSLVSTYHLKIAHLALLENSKWALDRKSEPNFNIIETQYWVLICIIEGIPFQPITILKKMNNVPSVCWT